MQKAMMFTLSALFAIAATAAGTGYHIIRDIKVGGEGGWDYLTMDSAARRLFVSHATQVVVVDVDAGKVVGNIPDTAGVHGIAIAPELNRGFTSNGRSNNVTIFDLKTLKTIGQVQTGTNPDSIRYDSVSARVFTFNGGSKNSTAIDAKTGKVASTIALNGKPEFSVADGKGKIYVNLEDTSEIVVLDTVKLTVVKRYSLSPCEEPSGLAMDTKARRLFSVCGNRLMAVSDPDAGKVLATPAIGAGPDGAAYDPETGYVFSSNGDGTMTVVHEENGKWVVVENLATASGARTIAVDEKTHNVYLPTAEFGPPPAGRGRGPALPNTFRLLVVGK